VEVIDPKPSADSSDKERLAFGISTIGLQTKRLSMAQRRKITRERRIREGNWTKENLQVKLIHLGVRVC
jgi:hypothetical protein